MRAAATQVGCICATCCVTDATHCPQLVKTPAFGSCPATLQLTLPLKSQQTHTAAPHTDPRLLLNVSPRKQVAY